MSSAIDRTWIWVSVAALIFGAWLLARGLRGRRVGDHPTCARCGFDLFGAPEGSERCPECGADVLARKSTRIGHRKRRPWSVAAGALCVLMAALVLVVAGVRVDWRSRLPTWVVLYEARSGSVASRVAPIQELVSRDAKSLLAAKDRVALARAMIAVQRSAIWNPSWGDWVAARLLDGSLPVADRNAFADNLVAGATARVANVPGPKLDLNFVVTLDWRRGGLATPSLLRGEFDQFGRTLLLDGVPEPEPKAGDVLLASLDPKAPFAALPSVRTPSPKTMEIGEWDGEHPIVPAGPHRVDWSLPLVIRPPGRQFQFRGPELARGVIRWSGTVNVKSADEVVARIRYPSDTAAFRAAIRVDRIELSNANGGATIVHMRAVYVPVNVAFSVFAKQGDGPERKLGWYSYRMDGANVPTVWQVPGEPILSPGKVDLIFRADAAIAAQQNMMEMWDGELRIEGVPVERGE